MERKKWSEAECFRGKGADPSTAGGAEERSCYAELSAVLGHLKHIDEPSAPAHIGAMTKNEAIKLIETLPDDCSVEEIQYHLYVRSKIERGLADVNSGRTLSHEDVKRKVREWSESGGRSRQLKTSG